MSFVLLVDDTRTFRDGREHVRARTSREALAALGGVRQYGHGQLWLDHDLGIVGGFVDSTLPILDELARAASDGEPYPFDLVIVHTSNPVGAATIMQVLERWGYPSRRVPSGDQLVDET
ncbi:hypothetical protein FHX52_1736 [Humibacillus xanthopallidus]|uniref:Cyclic-phosphate processing Receiver domain-containing protein n=1 Tax=Humibacillus xanthopallidus TaxID=412689 RepID=A0A543PWY6_9MICO|nr:hypothetical protein FHX52_1736 [Humibacillus xanthopallidus]